MVLYSAIGGISGNIGVIAFFILSGYLMADIAHKYKPVTFLWHRILRIYPIYWICVVAATALYYLLWLYTKPDTSYLSNIFAMLTQSPESMFRLVLAPMGFMDYPLGIEWTLLYEATFYILVFLVLASGRIALLPYFASAWLVLIVFALAFMPQLLTRSFQPLLPGLPLFTINSAFIFGILAAHIQPRIAHPLLTIGLGLAIVIQAVYFRTSWIEIEIGVGLTAFSLGLIALERQKRLVQLPWLAKLGDWSYALYLIHVPIIIATIKVAQPFYQGEWLVLGCVVMALLAASVVGRMDMALYRSLKRFFDDKPTAQRIGITAFLTVFLSASLLAWLASQK